MCESIYSNKSIPITRYTLEQFLAKIIVIVIIIFIRRELVCLFLRGGRPSRSSRPWGGFGGTFRGLERDIASINTGDIFVTIVNTTSCFLCCRLFKIKKITITSWNTRTKKTYFLIIKLYCCVSSFKLISLKEQMHTVMKRKDSLESFYYRTRHKTIFSSKRKALQVYNG